MARYLLDSDAVIDQLNGEEQTIVIIRDLFERGEMLCMCDIVLAEVYAGFGENTPPAMERLLQTCVYLPTSLGVARRAGVWRYQYARQGRALVTTDVLVAATAAEFNATIVTRN